MMSFHLALPREGQIYQLLQEFSYLDNYHNTKMIYDLSDTAVDDSSFEFKYCTPSEFDKYTR